MPFMISRGMKVLAIITTVSLTALQAREAWVVREDGIGPVRVGMTLSQLNIVLQEKFSLPKDKEDQSCFYVRLTKHPGIALMIENGRLSRVDVDLPGISTTEGVQVGDSEEHALRVYGGKLKVEPHAYTGPDGHYLTLRSRDGRYGIRFEAYQGKIQTFYAGRFKAVQYIEGCQ